MAGEKQGLKPIDLVRIQTVPLAKLCLADKFFDSLRVDYKEFNRWYVRVANEGRAAWLVDSPVTNLAALCIYKIESEGERITDSGQTFKGRFLKLCTFKVAERGIRYGERLLNAAFCFAVDNGLGCVYVQVREGKHAELVSLLERFGFRKFGRYRRDLCYVKDMTPGEIPNDHRGYVASFEYAVLHYPYHLDGTNIGKFIVSMSPSVHDAIFIDARTQALAVPRIEKPVIGDANAIQKALLVNVMNKSIHAGDLLFFYVKGDDCYIDCMGVTERVVHCDGVQTIDEDVINRLPYTESKLAEMIRSGRTMVLVFRLVQYLVHPITRRRLSAYGFDTNHKDVRRIPDHIYMTVIKPALKAYGVSLRSLAEDSSEIDSDGGEPWAMILKFMKALKRTLMRCCGVWWQ